MKKVVLGNGEKYAIENIYRGRPPGDIPNPYPYSVSSIRIAQKVANTLASVNNLPSEAMPNGEIVTALTLHPSFLAKSYYPTALLKDYSLTSLGSKEVFVKPEVAVNQEQKKRAVSSSVYFVSGKKQSFEKLLYDIENNNLGEDASTDLGKIEELSFFSNEQKIKTTGVSDGSNTYEVVLHLNANDKLKEDSFVNFITNLNGSIDRTKIRYIDGLAFCFVKIESTQVAELAKFVFVRVVRPAPKINLSNSVFETHSLFNDRKIINNINNNSSSFNTTRPSVAVFDGGLFAEALNTPYLRYFDLTSSTDNNSEIFSHGELVTSAVMYGSVDELNSPNHETIAIDHYKVFCEADNNDIGLVDVLDRISSILIKKEYKIVNISLGPSVPCPDDEPNLWTSTLDKIAGDGSTLIIIAAGNTGGILLDSPEDEDLARIQPPADMLNGLSIGAANSKTKNWRRANYSSIGPGRRPGYVKPDAIYFGGDDSEAGEKIGLIGLFDYEQKLKFGTSFAAPLVARLAARLDNMTQGKLTPATLRALLIHAAESVDDKKGCGWGRVSDDIEQYIFCGENAVTIIYQGVLTKSSGVRAAIPCPKILKITKTKVDLNATLCFYTEVDHKHPVSYSRAGIEIVFRPHSEKFDRNKDTGELSHEASTRTLFNKEKILGNEQHLRRDAHKWETCYKVCDTFFASTINDPSLDIKYLTRDEGHSLTSKEMQSLPELSYSLIITLTSRKQCDLYEEIINEYNLLKPISLNIENDVTV
ncbi:S8 family peptidase [Enterobacter cancerogenus]|uniref:S8 family peptidase n=1 Tax=Enterobacter cancerogenus TaxID=69218 RepID=UPI00381B5F78